MTSRVAWAIVWVTWAMLLAGGIVAYVGISRALTDALDTALAVRAATLPRLVGGEGAADGDRPLPLPPGDRFVVRTDLGQTIARSGPVPALPPQRIIDRQTVRLADGTPLRSVAVEVDMPDGDGRLRPVTVVYSSPTRALDAMRDRLLMVFVAVGVCSAVGAGLVSRVVARRALAPVHRAAEVLSTIDEANLGRDERAQRALDPANMPSELRAPAQRLREMLARFEHSARQRRRFLADAAHELRTPVAALMTTIEVALRHVHDPAAVREMLEDALGSTRTMRRLVEALLEHARGELTVQAAEETQRIDVAGLLAECLALARALGQGRGVRVEGAWPGELVVEVSPVRLRSIVMNLLSNAVEYTRHGGHVRLEAQLAEGSRRLRIVVSDDGPGIAPEDLPHLFEPFYRGGTASPQEEHHGLGLFLVATHARAMGGECSVESVPGQGARFQVTLPVTVPAA